MLLSWAQCTVQRFGLKNELSSVQCSTESCCAVVTLDYIILLLSLSPQARQAVGKKVKKKKKRGTQFTPC